MRTGDRVLTYVVERELGEGGMGSVYLARHTVLNQQVAIKVLSPLLSRDHAVRERFIQEANIQAALRHPGIVQVLNAGYEGEQPVLVMEYIEGNSLFEVLGRRGALPIDDALKIMEQVFSAVGYAHQQGVIHRDLKPENIMVTAVGDVKVTDFGIAKILGSARLTRTGTVMGSAYYMSPEQIMNPESVDTRSDIYSLGCLFYELLTGRPPFGEKHVSGTDNDFRVKSAHVNDTAPTLKTEIPSWLTQVVMGMLEKAPDQRPPSCEAILSSIKDNSSMKDALNEINSDKNKQSRETQEMGENISYTHGTETQNQLALDYQSKKRVEARLQAEEFVRNQEKYQKQKQKDREEKIKLFEEKQRADNTPAWISMLVIIFFTFLYFLVTKTPLQTNEAALPDQQVVNPAVTEAPIKELVTPDADNQRWKFNYYALEKPLLSNLAGSRKVMQVTLTVMTHYDDRVIRNVKTHELSLREGILGVMRKKTEADLRDADFRRALAEELRLTINSLLEKYEGFGGIYEVMFTEFIVQ